MRHSSQSSAILPKTKNSSSIEQRPVRSWVHLLAGANGGLATALVTSPLDGLRTRLQSDYHRPSLVPASPVQSRLTFLGPSKDHIRGTFQIIGSISHTEGWRGFYRGLGPSLAGVVPATAIKFYVYGNCKYLRAQMLGCGEDAAIVHAYAAVAAGIATATATNPIWLVKTRLQLDASTVETLT
ncbi:mitochondrial carrier [Pseudovirgaria hyperparasitica]|uniref:Mitochondrial carrier n=1 Tax=Pseudovirgaria hyperparasitica TaxID=470096 RepID=A0A6A6VRJ5_9PEZI|nr:mitochondrial carrier [Pseudovirgaria hyperparasitica]KAF2752529.1 mitochondrial carrier [Pseudovirgaria hyperparasitica]